MAITGFDYKDLTITFVDYGAQQFGGYGSRADVEGGAKDATKTKLDEGSESSMTLPINPEMLEISNGIDINNYKTPFFADLISISGLKLRTFTIDSRFPYDTGYTFGRDVKIFKQRYYINWIQRVMQEKHILLFAIDGDVDYLVPFTCVITEFSFTMLPDKDIEYSITVNEYIDYRNVLSSRDFVLEGDSLVVSEERTRPNLEGKITVGSIVKVVRGVAHINPLGTQVFSIKALSKLYQLRPQSFININTFFAAQQLSKELMRSDDMEWVVVSITPHTDFNTGGIKELYQSLCSNPLEIARPLNIRIKSLKSNDDGWVTRDQLKFIR